MAYKAADGQPGTCQLSIQLPMCLFCQVRHSLLCPLRCSIHALAAACICRLCCCCSVLVLQAIPPVKTADFKLTVSTTKEAVCNTVQVTELFADLVEQVKQELGAPHFECRGGPTKLAPVA